MIDIIIKKSINSSDLDLPAYATSGSSGLDLLASVSEDIILKPMQRKLVPTGISIEMPVGFEAQIRPRSGIALKNGVTVLNSPGTIDSDYRGEIAVIIINLGEDDYIIKRGMRIAQMVIAEVKHANLKEVEALSFSDRNEGGFGSTGR